MKKLTILTLIISASIAVLLSGCDSKNDSDKIKVAVSIVPQKAFVEAVAGDLVDVVVIPVIDGLESCSHTEVVA